MIGPEAAFFKLYPPQARPLTPPTPLGNAGGLSGARLYSYRGALGPFVARSWPVDGPDFATLAATHGWLQKAAGLGFVPVPIDSTAGPSLVEWQGGLWEIAPWMPGESDLARPPAPARLRAAFAGLAALLSRLATGAVEGRSPGLSLRVEQLDRLMGGEFVRLGQAAARIPDDPASAPTLAWIGRASALATTIATETRRASALTLPLQPCIRDARPDHFLFEGDRLVGLVDFGAMGIDTVAGDLARLLSEWTGADRESWRVALESFEAIRPLSGPEHRALAAFRRANAVLGAARWARWHFLEGRTFDDPAAVIRGLERGLRRIEEAT